MNKSRHVIQVKHILKYVIVLSAFFSWFSSYSLAGTRYYLSKQSNQLVFLEFNDSKVPLSGSIQLVLIEPKNQMSFLDTNNYEFFWFKSSNSTFIALKNRRSELRLQDSTSKDRYILGTGIYKTEIKKKTLTLFLPAIVEKNKSGSLIFSESSIDEYNANIKTINAKIASNFQKYNIFYTEAELKQTLDSLATKVDEIKKLNDEYVFFNNYVANYNQKLIERLSQANTVLEKLNQESASRVVYCYEAIAYLDLIGNEYSAHSKEVKESYANEKSELIKNIGKYRNTIDLIDVKVDNLFNLGNSENEFNVAVKTFNTLNKFYRGGPNQNIKTTYTKDSLYKLLDPLYAKVKILKASIEAIRLKIDTAIQETPKLQLNLDEYFQQKQLKCENDQITEFEDVFHQYFFDSEQVSYKISFTLIYRYKISGSFYQKNKEYDILNNIGSFEGEASRNKINFKVYENSSGKIIYIFEGSIQSKEEITGNLTIFNQDNSQTTIPVIFLGTNSENSK
jgi:regulator of replication initiation timing